MGIPGLLQMLKEISEEIQIKSFAGQVAAIDEYCWIHKAAIYCAEELILGIETSRCTAIPLPPKGKNVTRLIDRGDALQWAASVSLSPQEVTFAAGFLKRPLQQHCNLAGAVWYNRKASPPCCFQHESGDVKPFHIIWLPLTGQGTTYNHICPLLPWKCGAVDASLCVLWRGLNREYPTPLGHTPDDNEIGSTNTSWLAKNGTIVAEGEIREAGFRVLYPLDPSLQGGEIITMDQEHVPLCFPIGTKVTFSAESTTNDNDDEKEREGERDNMAGGANKQGVVNVLRQANATNEDEMNAKVRKNRGIGDEHHSTTNASEMSENTTIRGQAKVTNEDESNACTTSQEQHTAPKVKIQWPYFPRDMGKSLIYQWRFCLLGEMKLKDQPLVVVVSPLKSLIADQIRECERFGLSLCKIEAGNIDSLKKECNFDVLFGLSLCKIEAGNIDSLKKEYVCYLRVAGEVWRVAGDIISSVVSSLLVLPDVSRLVIKIICPQFEQGEAEGIFKCLGSLSKFPESVRVNDPEREFHVFSPPCGKCVTCQKDLVKYNDPVHVDYFHLRGHSKAVKVSLKCTRCDLFYGYSRYGNPDSGWKLYDRARVVVEASDACFCSALPSEEADFFSQIAAAACKESTLTKITRVCPYIKAWASDAGLRWCPYCEECHDPNRICFSEKTTTMEEQKIIQGLLDQNLCFYWTKDGYQLYQRTVFNMCRIIVTLRASKALQAEINRKENKQEVMDAGVAFVPSEDSICEIHQP
ncbi:Rad2 nuclease [Desmophyllum pertusum]|uniref:Rad2 nuclease n=1 Tax=Desmophyllum pertusum TaxID=174260 RepID=A0A9W9YRJ2_9CNID|nr:Rad2 nuclease [Desmophyllum pertusum]